jgi:GNAT superfamily N-acetyltransferase
VAEARHLRDTVEAIYVRSYVEAIASADPFDSIDAFMLRFDLYTSQPDFDLVVAYQGGAAIGQAWGWPLTEHSRRWEGFLSEPEPGFTREDGRRTFALSEIMVSQEWTGKGIAHALHDHLLSVRTESRATLLVELKKHQGLPCVLALRLAQSHTITSQLGQCANIRCAYFDARQDVQTMNEPAADLAHRGPLCFLCWGRWWHLRGEAPSVWPFGVVQPHRVRVGGDG